MASEGLQVRLKINTISPALARTLKTAKNPQAVMRAIGTQIVSITKRSFREPALRVTPWVPKKDGKPSNLILHGVLSKSIRVTEVTKTTVRVGTDRKYAAIHQLGGIIRPKKARALVFMSGGKLWRVKKVVMPARPFLPFQEDGTLAPFAEKKVLAVARVAVSKQLEGK